MERLAITNVQEPDPFGCDKFCLREGHEEDKYPGNERVQLRVAEEDGKGDMTVG